MYHRGLDSHSVNAKIFFKDELADVDVTEVKEKRPDLRKAAKSPFFALSYGGTYKTLMTSLRIDKDKAKSIVENYEKGYQATMEYAKQGLEFVKTHGYIVINEEFGHRLYWWDFPKWEYIKNYGKCNFDITDDEDDEDEGLDYGETNEESISIYNKKLSSYGRLARNSPPQGTSSIMTKIAMKNLFNWIVDNNYFGIVRIVNVTHDKYFVVYKLC